MRREPLSAGDLTGWVAAEDGFARPPVLLLHGGPGLPYDYLDGLAEELGDSYRVAAFQQRGLAPSATEGAFTIAEAVAAVAAVRDGPTSSATRGAATSWPTRWSPRPSGC